MPEAMPAVALFQIPPPYYTLCEPPIPRHVPSGQQSSPMPSLSPVFSGGIGWGNTYSATDMPALASSASLVHCPADVCSTGSMRGWAMLDPVGLGDPMSHKGDRDKEDPEGQQDSLLECFYC